MVVSGDGGVGCDAAWQRQLLITDRGGVREIARRGDAVWSWKPDDTPEYKFNNLQNAWRLPNGNTVFINWGNEWSGKVGAETLQAIEETPEKKMAWVLQSWAAPENLGPATTIQFLDAVSKPEEAHFGEFR